MKQKDNLRTIDLIPQPKPFVRSAYFETLRTLRRTNPARYISMSTGTKAQVELYCLMRCRDAAQKAKAARAEKIAMRGGFCQCCGESVAAMLTLDHIKPRADGGTGDPPNIQILCLGCNNAKGRNVECPHAAEARRWMLEHVSAA